MICNWCCHKRINEKNLLLWNKLNVCSNLRIELQDGTETRYDIFLYAYLDASALSNTLWYIQWCNGAARLSCLSVICFFLNSILIPHHSAIGIRSKVIVSVVCVCIWLLREQHFVFLAEMVLRRKQHATEMNFSDAKSS